MIELSYSIDFTTAAACKRAKLPKGLKGKVEWCAAEDWCPPEKPDERTYLYVKCATMEDARANVKLLKDWKRGRTDIVQMSGEIKTETKVDV